MSIKFSQLITDCLMSLGDATASSFSRTAVIWPWCIQAIQAFPVLRPMINDKTIAGASTHSYALPADFKEVISVEYPINQTPPAYLARKNRLDANFYDAGGLYDIDHDYTSGVGWFLYTSDLLAVGVHVKTQYLATHDIAMLDDDTKLISIPDEFEDILIAYVVARAYRQRLSMYMIDPTAHTSMIYQMTEMVRKADDNYNNMALRAQQKIADSRITPNITLDKFDRVY